MKVKDCIIALIAVVILLMVSSASFATPGASIVYNESEVEAGVWQYDYEFKNSSDDGEYLYSVILQFDQTLSTTGAPLPTGWNYTIWEGVNSSAFLDAMSSSSGNDIAPDNSMSGFSFTVNNRIGDIQFSAEFNDHSGNFSTFSGTTAVAAVIVPEPISSLLFLAGGTTLAARGWLRKKRVTV